MHIIVYIQLCPLVPLITGSSGVLPTTLAYPNLAKHCYSIPAQHQHYLLWRNKLSCTECMYNTLGTCIISVKLFMQKKKVILSKTSYAKAWI